MSRLAWFSVVLPLACFSESDPATSSGTEPNETSGSATLTTAVDETVDPPMTSSESSGDVPSTSEGSSSSTATPTTGADESDTSTGDVCAEGFVELSPLPMGWTDGVFVLSPAGNGPEELPSCAAGLDDLEPIVESPTITGCACTCEPACYGNGHATAGCGTLDEIFNAFDEECATIGGTYHVSFDADLGLDGGCNAPVATPVVAGTWRRTCEHIDGTACVIVPPDTIGPCVRRDGDHPCPDGPFSRKILTAASLDATCDPCADCESAAVDACLAAEVSLFSLDDCNGTEQSFDAQTCTDESGASVIVDFDLECPVAAATSGAIIGERTYCCVE